MTADRSRVLLVDDSVNVLETYRLLLEPDYDVKTATDADEAFALVRDWRPDVLLTDISMPGRSGLDLITQIRSDLTPPLPRIGVISGFPDFEAVARSRGAQLFLVKPVDLPTLRGGIEKLLSNPETTPVTLGEEGRGRRAAAIRDAEHLVEQFIADHPEAADVATRATEEVARYLGASTVLLLLVRSGELEVIGSSNPDHFAPGTTVGDSLGYATSVIASGATLYIPTGGALGDLGVLPDTDERLVACSAVRTEHGEPIAGLAVLSNRDRPFDSRDLAIVDDMSRSTQDVLLGRRPLGSSRVADSVFQTETWWRRLLDRELEWVGEGLAVSMALAAVERSPTGREEAAEVVLRHVSDHMCVAQRHERQLALFKRAADQTTAREEIMRCMTGIDEALGLSVGAVLTLSELQPPRRSEVALEILEGLMRTNQVGKPGTVVDATLTATVRHLS